MTAALRTTIVAMSTQPTSASNARTWTIRLVSLYIFSYLAFLVMGLFSTAFRIGPLSALWAALIFTLATVFVKPIVESFARKTAEGLKAGQSSTAAKIIEYVAVYAVAVVIWIIISMLSSLSTHNFWNLLTAPLFLLVAWVLYSILDDTIEKYVAKGYDAAVDKLNGPDA